MSKPWLIVDGYNVLAALAVGTSLDHRTPESMDAARAKLVGDVASIAVGTYRAVVVFDGAANPLSDGAPHKAAGVTVIFSRSGEDADSVIERLVARARARGEKAVVVTSDAATQRVVEGHGVTRISAAEFVRMLDEEAAERRELLRSGETRTRIADRIGPEIRDALARWARGYR